MRLNLARLKDALKRDGADRADLVFTVRPGNPAAVGASASDWKELIAFCIEKGMRLVNDAAYAGLTQGHAHVPLAQVAKDYPELEWLELYSISKSYNDPGARLGALVGSKDFVEDFILVKGNTDSGPVPGVMAAYGEFLNDRRGQRGAANSIEIRGLPRKARRLSHSAVEEGGAASRVRDRGRILHALESPEVGLGTRAPR